MARIVPLSTETLNDAISVIYKIFPYMSDQKNAKHNLKDSLIKLPAEKHYWVAINEDGCVVGITGLYNDRRDSTIVWLGWYGVHPEYRKQGIGTALLQFAIDEATRRGFSTLKLYTSSDENEKAAHILYRKFGFKHAGVDKESDKLFFVINLR